jgi:hypothetical protein
MSSSRSTVSSEGLLKTMESDILNADAGSVGTTVERMLSQSYCLILDCHVIEVYVR